MKFFKTPAAVKYLLPKCTWRIATSQKEIFLTFDDGPISRHTDSILKTLKEYNAKATFFCVGENLRNNYSEAKALLDEGHVVGNHTYNHLKAWQTKKSKYINNVELFESEFFKKFGKDAFSWLFRPPYGQITPVLLNELKRRGYKVVMWDILSYDFDSGVDKEKAIRIVKKKSTKGSIVVFHDNYKAEDNLKVMLPEFLAYFSERGFSFKTITNEKSNDL